MDTHDEAFAAAVELSQGGPRPGELYRHYKGGEYVVEGRPIKEDTLEPLVAYRSLGRGYQVARTLANFTEIVNGKPRFERVGERLFHGVYPNPVCCSFPMRLRGNLDLHAVSYECKMCQRRLTVKAAFLEAPVPTPKGEESPS